MDSVWRRRSFGLILLFGWIVSASLADGEVSLRAEGPVLITGNAGHLRDSIPIEVPPGRNGLTPRLSLVYTGSSANGFLGVGWDLSIPSIARSTQGGVNYACKPRTNPTPCFAFVMGGISAEVISRADLCKHCYATTIKGEALLLRALEEGWEITDRSGIRYFFGRTAASRQEGPSGTFRWMLDTVTDTENNTITYSYYQNQSESLGAIYINRIDYQSNAIFFFRAGRSDLQPIYTSEFAVVTAYRLETIEVLENGARVGKYELGYCGVIPSCPADRSGGSLLGSILHYGSNGVRALQPLRLSRNADPSPDPFGEPRLQKRPEDAGEEGMIGLAVAEGRRR